MPILQTDLAKSSFDPAEVETFLSKHPNIETIDVLIADMCGVLRGKRAPGSALKKLYQEGTVFPGSVFSLDITGDSIEKTGLIWEDGDADRPCWPIAGTLALVPWQKRPTAQLMLDMYDLDGSPFYASPRHLLARMTQKLKDIGLTPCVALELEFYLCDADWGSENRPRPPTSKNGWQPTTTQVYSLDLLNDFDAVLGDIADACALQDIPAEAAVAENAPGQFEINLKHVTNPTMAADHAIQFKRIVRGVAGFHRLDATFMAKPYANRAGNGLHVHVSLLNEQGENVFAAEDPSGSPMLHWAVGGLRQTMAEAMAIFAPGANSYRRLQPGSYAPNKPLWGVNNRTTALRVPGGPAESRRIEHRVSGADANPYLVSAAILAGMHFGITHKIDPGEPVTGNAYDIEAPELPYSWALAMEHFDHSRIIRQYFGEDFCFVLSQVKWAERDKFNAHVNPIEYEWYFRTA
jgi:glutamine synthetase